MYQKYYTRFLTSQKGTQHFAAHSHHYWPDVTRDAVLEYWDDSAKLVDHKWAKVFSEKIPATQKLIAEILNLSRPENITFAPNTHELLFRLISCLDLLPSRKAAASNDSKTLTADKNNFNGNSRSPDSEKKIKILTTDSEFYSFERQIRRLQEISKFEIEFIPTEPFANFTERFLEKIKSQNWDMVFFSHVFFNSGFVFKDFSQVVQAAGPSTILVMDAYHGFMAIPTDLKSVEDRLFYISGSYKYAQGGEGCCFMSSPPNNLRPINTGWFANMANLSDFENQVGYSTDGYRFAGSTMDYTALYRLHATLELLKKEKISVKMIHDHVQKIQRRFLNEIFKINGPLNKGNWISADPQKSSLDHHGHFLTFELPSTESASKMVDALYKKNIICDSRKNRIRFGFGIYQAEEMDLTAFTDL